MAAPKDLYKVLGVAESASADEIKKAYRKLAKKNHPDATGGDKTKEARFKEVSQAYETLGDEKKRAAYDEARKNPFAGAGGNPFAGGGNPFAGGQAGGNVDLGDLFSQFGRGGGGRVHVGGEGGGGFGDLFEMFGGGGARRGPRRGEDIVATLDLDLPEAALGAEKAIVVDGKRLTVKIPPGMSDGKTIRLGGQGRPGAQGGSAGDLLIELHERPHPRFRRASASDSQAAPGDIDVDVPVPVHEAVLGGKAEVPTLEGTAISLTVPPGTSSGQRLRMRGKGAVLPNGRGDLYAIISIKVPRDLSPEARDLMAQFAKATKK